MLELVLPWPPRELSPNARGHWAKRASVAKRYRNTCMALTRQATSQQQEALEVIKAAAACGPIHLHLEFVQPDRRARDDDNVFASFKAGRDGLAQALGIDDRHFRMHPCMTNEVTTGGAVRVRINLTSEDNDGDS